MGRTVNAVLLTTALLPGVLVWWWSRENCMRFDGFTSPKAAVHQWCAVYNASALAAVNSIFFVNVCLGFWIVSLLQSSTWLIDPYWTILPPLMYAAFLSHPDAERLNARSAAALSLVLLWSARLTHSYFRREEWQLGHREDWRFADMRRQYGPRWWAISFFLVYMSQQLMLVGICLPLLAVSRSQRNWRAAFDGAALSCSFTGLCIAGIADTQLHRFVADNERRRREEKPPKELLSSGLWNFSRHPNYFGELLFWWGIAGFGAATGSSWTAIGALFNTICMAEVTKLTEARMLRRPERRDLYRQYQATTSMWTPWPPKRKA